jgi:hypothetical protein
MVKQRDDNEDPGCYVIQILTGDLHLPALAIPAQTNRPVTLINAFPYKRRALNTKCVQSPYA